MNMMSNLKINNQEIKVIVGLGNQGDRFKRNRHNVGFLILDEWGREFNFLENKKLNSLLCQSAGVIWVKPLGFINESGDAVSKILNYYHILPQELLVIHDDLELPSGVFKLSFDKSASGHNGVRDIIEKLGTKAFYRLRYGIGRPENPEFLVHDYVLSDLSELELNQIRDFTIDRALKS